MYQERLNDNFNDDTNDELLADSDEDSPVREDLKSFEGYSYLVTRVAPAFYHIILFPSTIDDESAIEVASKQVAFNRLETCLVKDRDNCIYFSSCGEGRYSDQIPTGGTVVSGLLAPSYDFIESEELSERKRLFEEFKSDFPKDGYLFGDVSKGGHQASIGDLIRLTGNWNGIPFGLKQCNICGEYRGECLDPSPKFKNMVMRVNCLCENDNRCARCGELLYSRKLNANYYNREDGQIWHVPGFVAFDHKCPE